MLCYLVNAQKRAHMLKDQGKKPMAQAFALSTRSGQHARPWSTNRTRSTHIGLRYGSAVQHGKTAAQAERPAKKRFRIGAACRRRARAGFARALFREEARAGWWCL